MILDNGYCLVYNVENIAPNGDRAKDGLVLKYQSWYGELEFATAPYKSDNSQEDIEISARVRIMQNRAISSQDIAILSDTLEPTSDALQYKIVRAYHGVDSENGQPITDLTLQKVVQDYDIS